MSKTAADKVTEARLKGWIRFLMEFSSDNIFFSNQVKLSLANLLQQVSERMDRTISINVGAMPLLMSCHHLCVMMEQQVLILWIS
jgi:hypothetical protein